jgi:hypothetical protein
MYLLVLDHAVQKKKCCLGKQKVPMHYHVGVRCDAMGMSGLYPVYIHRTRHDTCQVCVSRNRSAAGTDHSFFVCLYRFMTAHRTCRAVNERARIHIIFWSEVYFLRDVVLKIIRRNEQTYKGQIKTRANKIK